MVVPGDKQRGLTERPRRAEEATSVLTSSRDVEHLYPQWRNVLEKGHIIAAIRNIEALAAAAKSPTVIASLRDELGRDVQGEKAVEVVYQAGKLSKTVDQFGVGKVTPGATGGK